MPHERLLTAVPEVFPEPLPSFSPSQQVSQPVLHPVGSGLTAPGLEVVKSNKVVRTWLSLAFMESDELKSGESNEELGRIDNAETGHELSGCVLCGVGEFRRGGGDGSEFR